MLSWLFLCRWYVHVQTHIIVGQKITRWRQIWGSHSAHIALPAIFKWCYCQTNESCIVSGSAGTISWPPCVTALPWRIDTSLEFIFLPAVSWASFLEMANTVVSCSPGYCRFTCLESICLKTVSIRVCSEINSLQLQHLKYCFRANWISSFS